MEEVRKFLEEMKTNPKAKQMIENLVVPRNDKQAIEGYYSVAKALNYSFSPEELTEGLIDVAKEKKEKTKEAANQVKQSVSEEDLDQVAGGQLLSCESTADPGEWCWLSDYCDVIVTDYDSNSYDPAGARDSFWDAKPGDDDYVCENLAEWEIIE